jgi:hypothetical protein
VSHFQQLVTFSQRRTIMVRSFLLVCATIMTAFSGGNPREACLTTLGEGLVDGISRTQVSDWLATANRKRAAFAKCGSLGSSGKTQNLDSNAKPHGANSGSALFDTLDWVDGGPANTPVIDGGPFKLATTPIA